MIAAHLVPPSACITSQSIIICLSPNNKRSTQVLSDLPISLCISKVLPPCFPLDDSLFIRLLVDLGNIPYSAVTQPRPVFLIKCGTFSSIVAVQIISVLPHLILQDPSAFLIISVFIDTGLI